MKAPLKVQLTMTVMDADNKVVSETVQTYHECKVENVVQIEQAVVGGLLDLGKKAAAAK